MRWKSHVRFRAGEKVAIISKPYLSLYDAQGSGENTDAYGISSEDCIFSGSGDEGIGALMEEELSKIKLFRNSDKVTIWIDGVEYKILEGAHDVGTVYEL